LDAAISSLKLAALRGGGCAISKDIQTSTLSAATRHAQIKMIATSIGLSDFMDEIEKVLSED
jgi:hypothetical protein